MDQENIALELYHLVSREFGYNLKKLFRKEVILAGQIVYDFYLFKTGIIDGFKPTAPDIYIGLNKISTPKELEDFVPDLKGEDFTNLSFLAIIDLYYPINIEQIVVYKNSFRYKPAFEKFLKTRQIEVTPHVSSELEMAAKLILFKEKYEKKLYVNFDSEFSKIGTFNNLIAGQRKYLDILNKNFSLVEKYFTMKFKNGGFVLMNKKEFFQNEISIPTSNPKEYRHYTINYWDLIYGGAKKVARYNFNLLKEYMLDKLFLKTVIENYPVQLKQESLAYLSKMFYSHDLSRLINRYSIDKTLDNFQYLKRLVNEYGISIFGMIETYQSKKCDGEKILNTIWSQVNNKSIVNEILTQPLNISNFDSKGTIIRELITKNALQAEGQTMKHCVGGYYGMIQKGNTKIFSLKKDKIRSTLELVRSGNRWAIRQHKSYCNSTPDYSLCDTAMKLCKFINYLHCRD